MDEPPTDYKGNQQGQALTGLMGVILLGFGWAAAYLLWPEGIAELPLGAIILGDFLRAIGAVVIAIFACGIAITLWIDEWSPFR